jgi:hypothetical protein
MKPRQFQTAENEMTLESCPILSHGHLENEQHFTNISCSFIDLMQQHNSYIYLPLNKVDVGAGF